MRGYCVYTRPLQPTNIKMEILNLNKVSFEELVDCFLLAFENYPVKMPSNKDYYERRWKAAKVDYNLSYGMFANGRLIGFIIHAIDNRFGIKTAFNTGTGVIPEFRGQRITKSIYDFAINDLKYNGIEKCTLEVIQENEKAIKAYQRVGFKICKEYICFSGIINIDSQEEIRLEKIDKKEFDWDSAPNQNFYSWDFQKETILERDYCFYHVIHNDEPESFFAFNDENKYIAQFDLLVNKKEAWARLFKGIKQISKEVKIINVDNKLIDKVNIINKVEIPKTVKQYEMELEITGGNR